MIKKSYNLSYQDNPFIRQLIILLFIKKKIIIIIKFFKIIFIYKWINICAYIYVLFTYIEIVDLLIIIYLIKINKCLNIYKIFNFLTAPIGKRRDYINKYFIYGISWNKLYKIIK